MKETYYERNKERILQRQKLYIQNNKEKVLKQKKEWARKHRAELREKGLLPPTKKNLQQKIDKAVTRIKTIINIIKEQPTDNVHTDMYIIEALNSLLYILEEVKENE